MPSVSPSRGKTKSIDFSQKIASALTSIPTTNGSWTLSPDAKGLEKLAKGRNAFETTAQKTIKKWVSKALSAALKEYIVSPSTMEKDFFNTFDFALQFKNTSAFITLVPFPLDQPKFETNLFSGKQFESCIEKL